MSATSSGWVNLPVAKPPIAATTLLAGGVEVGPGCFGDGVGDAALAEPEVGGDRAGGDRS